MATRHQRSNTSAAYSSPACYLHEFATATEPSTRGITTKRIYAAPERDDGFRVLIDRLWPRGMSRKRAALDAWLRDLAPSTTLRQWFHRDPRRWHEFGVRYRAELRTYAAELQALRRRARRERVTLLYAARDARVNHARVLLEVLRRAPRPRVRTARRDSPQPLR